jgi:hypothetical protein
MPYLEAWVIKHTTAQPAKLSSLDGKGHIRDGPASTASASLRAAP